MLLQIIVSVLLFALSAFLKGICDTLQFHFYTSVFADKKPMFWNPQVSWRNKYKDYPTDPRPRFFGATTFLVALTDAWHLLDTLRTFAISTALCVLASPLLHISGNAFVAWLVIWIALVFVIHSGAFHLSYTVLFKKKVKSQPNKFANKKGKAI